MKKDGKQLFNADFPSYFISELILMVVTKFLDKTRPNENGDEDLRVLRHAYLNSYFQTGYKNLMDLATIHKTEEEEAADPQLLDLSENYVKVDEIPFDLPVAD